MKIDITKPSQIKTILPALLALIRIVDNRREGLFQTMVLKNKVSNVA